MGKPYIPRSKCETWNMLHNTGSSAYDISKNNEHNYSIVNRHINRECDHFEPFEERNTIYADECRAISEAAMEAGGVTKEVKDQFSYRSQSSLSEHAYGRCNHDTPDATRKKVRIPEETCNRIRQEAQRGKRYNVIAEKFGYRKETIRYHAVGECNHNGVEPVKMRKATDVTEDMCIFMRFCYYEEARTYEEIVKAVSDFFGLEVDVSAKTVRNHIKFHCGHD